MYLKSGSGGQQQQQAYLDWPIVTEPYIEQLTWSTMGPVVLCKYGRITDRIGICKFDNSGLEECQEACHIAQNF